MQTICTSPEKNVLECNSNEETKEWKITDRLEFEPLGIINTKTFHTKNIVAKKYYEVILLNEKFLSYIVRLLFTHLIYCPTTTSFQRQGVDVSQTDGKSATISDSEMIKVEKSNDTNAENPFGDDDYEEDDDEW